MKRLKIALIQANFRSAFQETIPEIAAKARNQAELGPEDVRSNQDLFIKMVREAASSGANLVLSSESYLDGWSARSDILQRIAARIPGPETEELGALAKELGVWICAALFERDSPDIYNSAILLSAGGLIAGHYRKTHETKQVLTEMPYRLGGNLPVFETSWGKVGILVCHDRWYPEAVRTLRRRGAELILNPVAAGAHSPYHRYHEISHCVLRAQAYLNGVFWASCNCANHGGHSVIMAPDGSVLAEASEEECILMATLDPEAFSSYDFVSNLRDHLCAYGHGDRS